MLAEAGFGEVARRELPHDPQNDYYLCRIAASRRELRPCRRRAEDRKWDDARVG